MKKKQPARSVCERLRTIAECEEHNSHAFSGLLCAAEPTQEKEKAQPRERHGRAQRSFLTKKEGL